MKAARGKSLLVGLAGALAVLVSGCGERTMCFASVDSQAAADRLEEAADELGFDTEVETRDKGLSVTFEAFKTDADAAPFRRAFPSLVKEARGTLGHPGDGCLEKPFFD